MKKSILALVLASLALPAMAVLNQAQQDKLTSAMAVLNSYGINPVVVQDTINETNEYYKLTNVNTYGGDTDRWARDIQDKFVNGNMVVNSSSSGASFIVDNSTGLFSVTLSSSSVADPDRSFGIKVDNGGAKKYSWLVNGNYTGNKLNIELDYYTVESATALCASDPHSCPNGSTLEEKVEKLMEQENASYKYQRATEAAYARFIEQNEYVYKESDKLDVGGAMGRILIGKAKGLKPVIKDIGLQIAAAEIGKSAMSSCEVDYAVVCSSIGEKFVSISSQLSDNVYTPIMYEYQGKTYTHVSPGSNELTTTYTSDNGTVVTSNQALSSISHKSGFVTIDAVSNTQHYNDMLFDIGEISDAYITVMEEDFTFNDLAD